MSERVPEDIYKRVTQLVKYYYKLKERCSKLERDIIYATHAQEEGMPRGGGTGDPTAQKAEKIMRLKSEIDRKIRAIEQAFYELPDDSERYVIQQNLFKRIVMDYIDSPISVRTMKRIRYKFISNVARKLDEI